MSCYKELLNSKLEKKTLVHKRNEIIKIIFLTTPRLNPAYGNYYLEMHD